MNANWNRGEINRRLRARALVRERSNSASGPRTDDDDIRHFTLLPLWIAVPKRCRPPKAQTLRSRAAAVRKRLRVLPVPRRSGGVHEKSLLRCASERGPALGHASAFWSRRSPRAHGSQAFWRPRARRATPAPQAAPGWLGRGPSHAELKGFRR